MKNENITRAIAKAAVAIEFASWAMEAETEKDRLLWVQEATKMLKNSYNWLQEELPF